MFTKDAIPRSLPLWLICTSSLLRALAKPCRASAAAPAHRRSPRGTARRRTETEDEGVGALLYKGAPTAPPAPGQGTQSGSRWHGAPWRPSRSPHRKPPLRSGMRRFATPGTTLYRPGLRRNNGEVRTLAWVPGATAAPKGDGHSSYTTSTPILHELQLASRPRCVSLWLHHDEARTFCHAKRSSSCGGVTGPSQAACNGHGGSRVPAIRAELFIRLQHGKLLQSAR